MTNASPDFANDQVKLHRYSGMWFPLLVVAVFIGVLLFRSGVFENNENAHGIPPGFAHNMTVRDAAMESMERGEPLLVMFSASWCPPCKRMKAGPLRSQEVQDWLETTGDALYVDVDQQADEAREWGIRAMPTFVLLNGGYEVKRIEGGMDARHLIDWLNSY
ncbi:MAG: thioredoxin family protein [Phycisphaeraceae bacterium]|nr:thioredoxin family protein [Phycisphaerales bacterium]MCB9861220.1 thioredoxin family protein [Phycisphaeraceae bacterium]